MNNDNERCGSCIHCHRIDEDGPYCLFGLPIGDERVINALSKKDTVRVTRPWLRCVNDPNRTGDEIEFRYIPGAEYYPVWLFS